MVSDPSGSPNPVDLLRQSSWFKAFSDSDLQQIVSLGTRQSHAPYTHIVVEGEVSSGLYIILRGVIGILKSGPGGTSYDIGELREGALFGELSLLKEQPRAATCRSLTSTEVLYIARDAFQQFLAQSQDRQVKFYESCVHTLMQRLHELDEHYTANQILLWKTAAQRKKEAA